MRRSEGLTRRAALRLGGTACAVAGCIATAVAWTAALVPRVLYEPSPKRKLGPPRAFPEGHTYLSDHRLFLIRQGDTFRALSAVCTHLGCTVGRADKGYHCPCHGSSFGEDGTNTAGPAPRPLPWRPLTLAGDGALVVDMDAEADPGDSLTLESEDGHG